MRCKSQRLIPGSGNPAVVTLKRGEIWWAELPEPRGSEPGFRRPVLIVQSDVFNASPIQTLLVAIVTSNLKLAEAPGNVKLTSGSTGLSRDSVVNVSQIFTLDRRFLREFAGELNVRSRRLVDEGLRLVMDV